MNPITPVSLRRLDDVASDLGISQLDLIKSDIDGREPFLFRGVEQTLRKFKPVLVLEVAEHCLQSAGTSAAELGCQLTDLGYVICSEATRSPYANQVAYLAECGSMDRSANILAVHSENVPRGISLSPFPVPKTPTSLPRSSQVAVLRKSTNS